MNSAVAVLFASLVAYCSAGDVSPITNTGDGEPVCDVSEQVDFQICLADCIGEVPSRRPTGSIRDSEGTLHFLTCLASCHLEPFGYAPPSPGEAAVGTGPNALDDLLEFTICNHQCYKDWVDAISGPGLRPCFEEEYTYLSLCYYDCVRGNYEAVRLRREAEQAPGRIAKRQALKRSRRANDPRMLLKVEYVICYVNCFEKGNNINILQATGFIPSPPGTCEARDTVIIGQCNGRCYVAAMVGRGRRALDSETTYDRLKTTECEAFCLRDADHPCVGHMIYELNVCINDCLIAKYRTLAGGGPVAQ